jgi:hypothetical protein
MPGDFAAFLHDPGFARLGTDWAHPPPLLRVSLTVRRERSTDASAPSISLLRAGTERVSVGQVRGSRALRDDDRHERVRLRVCVVTDRHLSPVLILRGGRRCTSRKAERSQAGQACGQGGRREQTSQPPNLWPWRRVDRGRCCLLNLRHASTCCQVRINKHKLRTDRLRSVRHLPFPHATPPSDEMSAQTVPTHG